VAAVKGVERERNGGAKIFSPGTIYPKAEKNSVERTLDGGHAGCVSRFANADEERRYNGWNREASAPEQQAKLVKAHSPKTGAGVGCWG